MNISQIISFDPSNREHREDLYTLLSTKCFGRMKNRYSLEGNYGSLYNMMVERVAEFYCKKEFK